MIPVNEPILDGREKELLIECIESGWISSDGPFVEQFERGFADYIGVDSGIAVASGTAALETALFAAGISAGDEIIMPSFTIISCALAAIRLGAVPVLVDVEPETWNMNTADIEARITSKTKMIMTVHMYGHPVDMNPIQDIAARHGLTILEDAAQVHGAEYEGRKCGSLGHLAAFSFYANKIITTGEGGMVLTSNPEMEERARHYRNLCFDPKMRFFHEEMGANYRMTNLQAAVGIAQLERIEEFVARKRESGRYYQHCLSSIEGIKTQVEKSWARMVYWMYCIEIEEDTGISAEQMSTALRDREIGSRPFFTGLHEQPALLRLGLFQNDSFPVTERISKQGLYLPSGLNLEKQQIKDIAGAVAEIISDLNRSAAG